MLSTVLGELNNVK
jgi:hypothetical protein